MCCRHSLELPHKSVVLLMITTIQCFYGGIEKFFTVADKMFFFFHLKSTDHFISPKKHRLLYSLEVLIEALLKSTHNMFSWRNKKNMWISPLICGYDTSSGGMFK